jgi:hypothetical protein
MPCGALASSLGEASLGSSSDTDRSGGSVKTLRTSLSSVTATGGPGEWQLDALSAHTTSRIDAPWIVASDAPQLYSGHGVRQALKGAIAPLAEREPFNAPKDAYFMALRVYIHHRLR